MFLRRCKRRKNGKPHTYWALVESYRTARGSRQRLVAYLGELQGNEPNGWAQLGRRLDGRSRPQRSLFDPPPYDDPDEDEPVAIHLKGVRLERIRDFGDVWPAWAMHLERCWKSSPRSRAAMWSCRLAAGTPRQTKPSGFVVSPCRIQPRKCS